MCIYIYREREIPLQRSVFSQTPVSFHLISHTIIYCDILKSISYHLTSNCINITWHDMT